MTAFRKSLPVVLGILAFTIMGTGCSTSAGHIGHDILTQVQLNQANFNVLRSVQGEAKADYYFGIGPSDQDLLGRAKREMIRNAQLKGPQALVNVTTDIKLSAFFIWTQRKAYVSAEVIEFK
jgi:hypothetical protein